MDDVLGWLGAQLFNALSFVHDLLDICPFPDIIASLAGTVSDGLGWLNWFVPVGGLVSMLLIWLGCFAAYYAVSILLRWIKAIGD